MSYFRTIPRYQKLPTLKSSKGVRFVMQILIFNHQMPSKVGHTSLVTIFVARNGPVVGGTAAGAAPEASRAQYVLLNTCLASVDCYIREGAHYLALLLVLRGFEPSTKIASQSLHIFNIMMRKN